MSLEPIGMVQTGRLNKMKSKNWAEFNNVENFGDKNFGYNSNLGETVGTKAWLGGEKLKIEFKQLFHAVLLQRCKRELEQ